jgi:RNA polymerase sigma-70 factor (ECF subfamily)
MMCLALMENATETLTELYDRHGRAVWAYARALAPRGDRAEDFAAEAFLALARRLKEEGAPPDPLGYLLSCVRSRVADEARRRRTAERRRPPLPPAPPRPDQDAARAERRARVLGAVRGLEPPLAEAVALHALAGLTFEEAARIANVPRSTLESRYALALDRLSFLLKEVHP